MSATGLVGLGARRALGRGLLAVLVVVWVVVLLGRPELSSYGTEPSPSVPRLDARRAVWTASLALLLPALVLRAASIRKRWRNETRFWAGARPVPHGVAVTLLALGTWCGGAVLLLATAVVAEAAAGGNGPALRLTERLDHPALALLDERTSDPLPLPPLRAGSELSLRLTPVPGTGGSDSTIRLWLQEGTDKHVSAPLETGAADGTRRRLLVEDDARAPHLHARRTGAAAFLVASSSIEVLAPGARERDASRLLFADALLAWAAWCALACALGAWLRPAIAGLACLALWCLPWAFSFAPGTIPGTMLPGELFALERGLVPPGPRPLDVLLAAAAVLVAAAVLRRRVP